MNASSHHAHFQVVTPQDLNVVAMSTTKWHNGFAMITNHRMRNASSAKLHLQKTEEGRSFAQILAHSHHVHFLVVEHQDLNVVAMSSTCATMVLQEAYTKR